MIVDTGEVPEDALRRASDERSAEFNQPERRLVERLVYSDRARAENAKARLEDGVLFEMLVAERGLEMADVDMGDVSADDLGTAADAVFAAESGDVVGPVETSLGPALFRINGILSAQVTSFEDAEPQLGESLARDRASRVIDTMSERVDDLLAGGATLEDVARETELELGTVEWHPDLAEGIAGYAAFRNAAEAVQESDYPAVERMEDGGIFTLRLDGIEEPRILPLEDVREAVRQGWREEATAEALAAQVAPQLDALRNGASFADLGLEATEITDMTRRDYRADAPPEFIERVFAMEQGEVQVIEGEGRLFVLRLDSIAPPAEEDEEMNRLRNALRDQVASDLGQDIFQILANDIRARAGVELDQSALNAVHANFN
jgi:peptidyl-prolyl cis-trans isomerase D